MRMRFAIAVVVLQVGLLAYMAGEREWVLHTGRVVHFTTAPIDPHDPMRGEYARLEYDLSQVPRELCRDLVLQWMKHPSGWRDSRHRDARVYATLQIDESGYADLVGLSDRPPASGPYLRGRVNWVSERSVNVRFGLEALFMQQGAARKLEEERREPKAGVPLATDVALSPGGLGVLQGCKWEPLGITLTLDRPPRPAPARDGQPAPPRGLTGVTVELKNHSTGDVALVLLPEDQSFRLVAEERWQPNNYRWAGGDLPRPKPLPADVVVLKPGESRKVRLDFTLPYWFVNDTRAGKSHEPVAMEKLAGEWGSSFRIEYAPPSAADCAGLPNASLIHHRRLRSRMFSAAGDVD